VEFTDAQRKPDPEMLFKPEGLSRERKLSVRDLLAGEGLGELLRAIDEHLITNAVMNSGFLKSEGRYRCVKAKFSSQRSILVEI
jgi:hypothetical protein